MRVPLRYGGAFVIVLTTVLASGWSFLAPTRTQDEIILLIFPDMIAHGHVPNRDFFTPYGPGTFWPLAVLYQALGGPSVLLERLLGLGYHVIVALGVARALRPVGSGVALLGGVLSALIAAPLLLIPYGWVGAIGAILWSLNAADERRWALAGGLAIWAVAMRPELVVLVVVLAGVVLPDRAAVRRYLLGLAVAGIPLAVHIAIAGEALFQNVVVERVGVRTQLALDTAPGDVLVGAAVTVVASLLLVARAVVVRDRRAVAIAVLAVMTLPQVFQRLDLEHVLFVAMFSLPLCLAALPVRWNRTLWGTGVAGGAFACVLGVTAAVLAPHPHQMTVNGRSLLTGSQAEASALGAPVAHLEAALQEGDELFVGVRNLSQPGINPAYLYYLLPEHLPDAYFVDFAPGVTEREGSPLLGDLKRADVLILLDFSAEQRKRLFPYIEKGSPQPNAYVTRRFCPPARLGAFFVYERAPC